MTVRRAAWWGTAVFALTAAAAAASPDLFAVPAFAVAVALFLVGCVAFVAAYSRAVRRSREAVIGVMDLYLLTGDVAPPEVRRSLLGALAAQVAVGLGSAIARPYSSLAAGTLVPVYGLALCGLWASRHGTFPARLVERGKGGGGKGGGGSGKGGGGKGGSAKGGSAKGGGRAPGRPPRPK